MRIAVIILLAAAILILSLSLLRGFYRGSSNVRTDHASRQGIQVQDADGRSITTADLQDASGAFRWEIPMSINVPAEARSAHERGREAGAAGDYKGALRHFADAARIAPEWPYPVYDAAYTYLLMDDPESARVYYRKTVDLAPRGFFTAITALDSLDREHSGTLPAGTYLRFLALESMSENQRLRAINMMTEQLPRFGPAWRELAALTEDDVNRLTVIEKGLATNPDVQTKGVLLINKALILDRRGNRDAAVKILRGLAEDPKSTLETEYWAKATLAMLLPQPAH